MNFHLILWISQYPALLYMYLFQEQGLRLW
jgi:hypothetical protein